MTSPPTGARAFYALHRHGFVRVATSTPRVRTADVGFNRDAILAEARRADAAQRRPRGLPRALRLLLRHRRPAPAVRAARRRRGGARRRSPPPAQALRRSADRRAAPRTAAGSTTARLAISRGRILGVVPKSYLPELPRVLREALVRHGRDVAGETIRVAGREVPFGSDLLFEATDLAGLRLPRRDLRGLLGGGPALDRRRRSPAPPSSPTSRPRTSSSASPTSATCSAARSRPAPSPPTSIPPPAPARAPPTSPGTARA